MTKLDKIKEDIGALKTYQGYLIAIIITIIVLARYMHKKINEIEEL